MLQVKHVVSEMARFHRRWALVRFKDGRHEFFDYMVAWQVNDLLLERDAMSKTDMSRHFHAKIRSETAVGLKALAVSPHFCRPRVSWRSAKTSWW